MTQTRAAAPRVLIVGNNAMVRAMLARVLSTRYEVYETTTINDALWVFACKSVDAVVADAGLEDAASHDSAWLLAQAADRGIKGVLLTETTEPDTRFRAVLKPITPSTICGAIDAVVDAAAPA